MPLYEYECEICGVRFEVIQKFSDAPVEGCKACGGKVHRLLSAPAIHFKGTGWYVTDYAKKGNGAEKPSSSPGSTTASSSASGTSEPSKPSPDSSTSGASATPSTSTSSSNKK